MLLAFFAVFSIVALSHELGHFYMARKANIDVHELALGLGPRIFGFKKGKTTYAINLFPIAGYVKVAGIDEESDTQATAEEHKYFNKPPLSKLGFIAAGALTNLFVGYLIIFILITLVGMPTGISNSVASVLPNSTASRIGILPGDKLIAINGKDISDPAKAIAIIHDSPGHSLSLTVQRGELKLVLLATPKYDPKHKVGIIGFTLAPIIRREAPLSSLLIAGTETYQIVQSLLNVLGQLFVGQIPIYQLAGPIGIAQATGHYAQAGWPAFLGFLAFFSINVAVLNLLPIPALDGGRIVFVLIELLRRKPIDIKVENRINAGGMAALLFIIMIISINDIVRLLLLAS